MVFVGRERELGELVGALDAARDGLGSLCLLVGEPGVGKTSLAERPREVAVERVVRSWRGDRAAGRLAPAAGESPTLNAERRRFELFDAVVGLLAASSAPGPLVVVLDDLHAADEGSLLLLSFLARQLHGMSLLVVASQRDVDAAPPPAVGREIGRSIRTGAVARYDPMGPVATRWRVRA